MTPRICWLALALACGGSAAVSQTTSGCQESSNEQPRPGGTCPFVPHRPPSAAEILQYERDNWPNYLESGFARPGTTPAAVRALHCRSYRDFEPSYFCRYRLFYVENRTNGARRLRSRAVGGHGLGAAVERGCDGRLHAVLSIIETDE